jgi:hypothetical protein
MHRPRAGDGKLAIPGRDAAEQQHQHLHTPPPATPVGPTLARWILRLLDNDPARRPQDAESALDALPSPRRSRSSYCWRSSRCSCSCSAPWSSVCR